jgi:hypothetical protein
MPVYSFIFLYNYWKKIVIDKNRENEVLKLLKM